MASARLEFNPSIRPRSLIPTYSYLAAIRSASNSSARPTSAPQDVEEASDTNRPIEQQLAPIDGGSAAWRLLSAAFVFETLLWGKYINLTSTRISSGFPLSFGVFQDYYSKSPEFADSRYIPIVGTIASGLGYLGAPLAMLCIQRFSRYRRQMIWLGWPICILGLALGSFATTLEALILSQGVAYGTGFLIFYYPILSMVDEYWIARRGMAYGILCAASGFSGSFMPFLLQSLLSRYGWKVTLRVVAVALTVLTGPLIPLLKGRLPDSRTAARRKINWTFLSKGRFWVYTTANLIQGFGYFFPSLYLPSFATSLGFGGKTGAMLLAVMSISQVLGQFTFGYVSDRRISVDVLACTSTAVAAAACLAIWNHAATLPLLILFSILYGFFAAGFTSLWARMTSSITEDVVTSPVVFGILNAQKGVGNVVAGSIGGALVSATEKGQSGRGEGEGYGGVIMFTGVCMLRSTGVVLCRWAGGLVRKGLAR